MASTETTPSVASQPDHQQDHPATTLPSNIEALLHAVRILLGYGRHLIDTLHQRAKAPNFAAIAANYGTSNLSTILAHLNRGILRAVALERVLLARAASGRDIDFIERRTHTPEPEPAPADAEAPQPTPSATAPKRIARPSRRMGWNDPEFFM